MAYKAGKRFYVVRGIAKPNGKDFTMGTAYLAETAREAVAKDQAFTDKAFAPGPMDQLVGRIEPHPILRVYEMTLVDEAEWR